MQNNRSEEKTVLVTGGTTGIGFASAQEFVKSGAEVYITGTNPDTLEAARSEFNGSVKVVQSDASDPASIQQLIETIKEESGKIDALVLNAGVFKMTPIEVAPLDDFDFQFNINVRGPWYLIQKALPLMGEGSSITWVTSSVNEMGWANMTAYAATKAAARSMVRTLAAELAPRGIRVNAIAPGPVETPIFGKANIPDDQKGHMAENIISMVPLGRMGKPEEVGKAIEFIAGSQASFVTGAEWAVDGGIAQI